MLKAALRAQGLQLERVEAPDLSMVMQPDHLRIEDMPSRRRNFLDLQSAIELFTPIYQLFLTDDDFWRATNSLQLDETERGFAYAHDAPLDMRMDPTTGVTAAEVLNTYDARDLTRVLSEYGEERFARKIAGAIVREREVTPFDRSGRLVELLRATIPMASQRGGGHPAKRTFQALRIEVNAELATWQRALPVALQRLAVGGRIAVLSFHSLEDRITKRALTAAARSSAPVDLPVELPEHAPELRLLTRGAQTPTAAELAENPRSASVRLRAAERIRPPRRPEGTPR